MNQTPQVRGHSAGSAPRPTQPVTRSPSHPRGSGSEGPPHSYPHRAPSPRGPPRCELILRKDQPCIIRSQESEYNTVDLPSGTSRGAECGAAAAPGWAAGGSGYGRLVDQVKYIRNNYFPTGRPPILYPRAAPIPDVLPRGAAASPTASLVQFDTEKGFTEQHSSSGCKVARVTSPRVPWTLRCSRRMLPAAVLLEDPPPGPCGTAHWTFPRYRDPHSPQAKAILSAE